MNDLSDQMWQRIERGDIFNGRPVPDSEKTGAKFFSVRELRDSMQVVSGEKGKMDA